MPKKNNWGRGRPRAEEQEERERHLIMTARENFYRDGFGATTMDAVAAQAKVSKSTLYSRFRNKIELFHAVFDFEVENWREQAEPSYREHLETLEPKSLEDAITTFSIAYLDVGMTPGWQALVRLVVGESSRFPDLAKIFHERANVAGAERFAYWIREFARRDGVKCRNARQAAMNHMSTIVGWHQMQLLLNENPDPAEWKREVRRLCKVFVAGRAAW